MQVILEQDILDTYCRYTDQDAPEMVELGPFYRPRNILATVTMRADAPQFVVRCRDTKFYPISKTTRWSSDESAQYVLASHTSLGFYPDMEGFDTLDQAIVWWDTCQTQ